jgi:hypothetical protein
MVVAANEGFQALGPAITSMTSQELAQVMNYTILPQVVYSPGLTNNTKFLALNGENITIMHNGNNLYVNSAQLLIPDILIANGVIHVIDNVLNPQGPNAQPNPQIGTQAPVFASASMVTNLPFTSSIPCTVSCPVTTTSTTSASSETSSRYTHECVFQFQRSSGRDGQGNGLWCCRVDYRAWWSIVNGLRL